MAASLLPCAIKTHYSWAFGSVYGPTTYPPETTTFDCFCGYTTVEDDGGDEGFNLVIPANVGCASAIFRIAGTRGGAVSDRVKVYCDATLKYDSGCGFTDFDSGDVAIPAGTVTMQISVEPKCSGTDSTYWSFYFSITCP